MQKEVIMELWCINHYSIEKKQILGHGQYGTVHQGLFHNGNAV